MIFTGYYAKLNQYKNLGLEPIAISGKRPDFYDGLYYPEFAPRWETFKKWKDKDITNEGYAEEYKKYLDSLDKEEIKKDFKPYMNSPKNHVILLCYEKPSDFCHRHVLAEWLFENLGIEVAEYYVGG